MLRAIQRACVIAFVGVLVGGAHAVLTTKPIKLKPDETKFELPAQTFGQQSGQANSQSPDSASKPAPSTDKPRILGLDITLADAIELQKLGAQFVDARHRDEYESGHIADAYLLPADMFYNSNGKPDALNYIDTNTILVVYCGGGQCDASHNTARLLQEAGYKRTHVLTDGFPAWRDAGYPVGTGKPAYE